MEEEKIGEVINQSKLQVRVRIMKTGVFGEYAFRGEDEAELASNGKVAEETLKKHLTKWEK